MQGNNKNMSYNESGGASEDGRDKGQWLLMSSNDSIYEYDIAQVCCLNYLKYIVKTFILIYLDVVSYIGTLAEYK